eukprot:m.80391 g.80391  ORF g.80391 m.80391 type:complete len:650 (+) comp25307_c1_seq1:268-2217(+)
MLQEQQQQPVAKPKPMLSADQKQLTTTSIAPTIFDEDKQSTMGRQVKMSDDEISAEMKDLDDSLDFSRMDVNSRMTKELRLRDGCKNLLRAIPKNPKNAPRRNELKQQLVRIQKNISKLHRKLQRVNWSVSRSRSSNNTSAFPLLAISPKDSAHLDLAFNLAKFIEMHYHEQPSKFDKEINTLQTAREGMRNASCSEQGKADILAYHSFLQQAEHRFFQEDKCLDTVFTWYDVFEGHPVTKKSLKLEKASVLFNAAAISAQIALRSDLNSNAGLEKAIEMLESSAGTLQYVREDSALKNSVGTDLARSSLSTLSTLMLAQAQECIWYSVFKKGKDEDPSWQPCGAEAAAVSEWYTSVRESFRQPLSSSVPRQWVDIVCLKEAYYRAIADWYTGIDEMGCSSKLKKVSGIAKVYRASLSLSAGLEKWNKMLPEEAAFGESIADHLSLTQQVLSHISEEIIEGIKVKLDQMPIVTGKAVRWATTNCEDLIKQPESDLFSRLGPVYFFNSMCALVERRVHTITYSSDTGFGMTLSGGNPVRVSDVTYEGPACQAGVLAGDYIIEVAGQDVRCMVTGQIEEVLAQHSTAGCVITIAVVVNYDMQNFEELINPEIPKCAAVSSGVMAMPGAWAPTRQTGTFAINGRMQINTDEA